MKTSPANVSEPPMNRFRFYVESVTEAVPHRRRRHHKHGNAVWSILLIGFAVVYFGSHMLR